MKDDSDSAKRDDKTELEAPLRKKTKKRGKSSSRSTAPVTATPAPAPAKTGKAGNTNTILFAVLALALGGAGGWFLRDAKAAETVEAGPDAVSPASPAGSSSVCGGWATKVCEGVGAESEPCQQAQAAAALLPDAACDQALKDVPGTLAKAKNARSACDELVKKLCADLGPETETCKMVTEQTPQFPVSRCTGILAQYDDVLGELKQQEKAKQPLSAEVAAKIAAGDVPSFGPKDAKVTVVEFSDFECPYCAEAAKTLTALKEKYADKSVRIVFRQFPLSFHKQAQLAAEASLAAHAQGKFWAFHDKVFENQSALDRASLEKHAADVGLDVAKFKKALDEGTFTEAVKGDMKLAEELPVSGTPTVVVGTKRIESPSVEEISKEIDAQLGG